MVPVDCLGIDSLSVDFVAVVLVGMVSAVVNFISVVSIRKVLVGMVVLKSKTLLS